MLQDTIARFFRCTLFATLCLSLASQAHAQRTTSAPRTSTVQRATVAQRTARAAEGLQYAAVVRDTAADSASAKSSSRIEDLKRAYGSGDRTLLWTRGVSATATARALLAALDDIGDRGLAPADFDVTGLHALADAPFSSDDQRLEFDNRLSVASMRVLRALRWGRAFADSSARPDSDAVYAAFRDLASGASPAAVLDGVEPKYLQYAQLRQSLPRYRSLATVNPAIVGRVAQIERALDSWRSLPHESDGLSVIVNVPAFELYVLTSAHDTVASVTTMDVVVGESRNHQTPIFSDSMRYIEFAPYWNVPMSLVKSELLPIARRDPYVLTMNGYQILNLRGQVLPATAASVSLVTKGKARIRQLPGGTNALGKVKFMFPNKYDVYLHDTPTKPDFLLDRRDRSHGCVRVADPAALAALLLQAQGGWDAAAISAAMNSRMPTRVELQRAIPVHIIYATAAASADGSVAFYQDVYGLDAGATPRPAADAGARP